MILVLSVLESKGIFTTCKTRLKGISINLKCYAIKRVEHLLSKNFYINLSENKQRTIIIISVYDRAQWYFPTFASKETGYESMQLLFEMLFGANLKDESYVVTWIREIF